MCGIKCKHFECSLEYTNVKDDLMLYKCLCYQKLFDENFKKRFANTYIFSNDDINRFILLLQKGTSHMNK